MNWLIVVLYAIPTLSAICVSLMPLEATVVFLYGLLACDCFPGRP
jgi:hypothetical protein